MKSFYQIAKTLGRFKAVPVESLSTEGYCIENFQNKALKIYKNGRANDFSFNGITFPYVYTLHNTSGDDIWGGHYSLIVEFEILDTDGNLQHVKKNIYSYDINSIQYFFKFIYNLSCCESVTQCYYMYKLIFDNNNLTRHTKGEAQLNLARETLIFIRDFRPRLDAIKDDEFLLDLKDRITETKIIASEIMAKFQKPV